MPMMRDSNNRPSDLKASQKQEKSVAGKSSNSRRSTFEEHIETELENLELI